MEAPLPASAISFSMRWVNSANLVHSAAQFVGTAMIVVVVIVGLPLHRPVDAEPIQILEGIRGNFWLADDLLRGRASGPALAQPSVRTPAPASCYERLAVEQHEHTRAFIAGARTRWSRSRRGSGLTFLAR